MEEDAKKNVKIEYELADIISERPQEFKVGENLVRFYPVTLAKKYLLKKHFDSLGVDKGKLKENAYVEALRLVTEKRDTCCEILAIYTTPNTYKDLYDADWKVARIAMLDRISTDELAALLINILISSDNTELLLKHLGIDKERERLTKIMEIKNRNGKNNITIGGVSIFGSFIGQLKEIGYTDNEILFERGYTFLRLMLADKITSIYMTDDDMKDVPTAEGGNMLDANNPDSFSQVSSFFASKGIQVK